MAVAAADRVSRLRGFAAAVLPMPEHGAASRPASTQRCGAECDGAEGGWSDT